jgi:hypothetical protein
MARAMIHESVKSIEIVIGDSDHADIFRSLDSICE